MTDRARYTMKMAFKVKLGVWFTDTELDQFLNYIAEAAVVSKLLDQTSFPADGPNDFAETSICDAVVSLFEKIQGFKEMMIKANRAVKR